MSLTRALSLGLALGLTLHASSCLVGIGDAAEGGRAGTDGGAAGGSWPDAASGGLGGQSGSAGDGGSSGSAGAAGAASLPAFGAYAFRRPIAIATGSVGLPSGYSLAVTFDHASLVASGAAQASGDDVRIARFDGSSWSELDRVLDAGSGWDRDTTTLWFSTSEPIAAGTDDVSHYLFWGDPSAAFPPSDLDHVFLFWDGFESGLGKWTIETFSFDVTTDQAHGGQHSLSAGYTDFVERRLIANGLDLGDIVFEAWWRLSSTLSFDVAQGVRVTSPNAWNGGEVNLEDDGTLVMDEYVAGAYTPLWVQPAPDPPAADVWTRVELHAVASRMKAVIDGVGNLPPSGWTDMQGGSPSGSVWLRSWQVPSAGGWWVDDVRIRRRVDPEPSVALGRVQTR